MSAFEPTSIGPGEIPLTATGKVRDDALRELLSSRADATAAPQPTGTDR